MIPELACVPGLEPTYRDFLRALVEKDFSGDVLSDFGSRLAYATDNSVYQILPQTILCPRTHEDIVTLARLAHEPRFRNVALSPRGGGTGTNGQSLTDGIAVDVSRHMSRILEVNLDEGWVRVEPGVVLDQLNAHLRPLGRFFAPSVSPSNRATLGGMIATDACGKGSRVYGRTSNHVLELRLVLPDGSEYRSQRMTAGELAVLKRREDRLGEIVRVSDDIAVNKEELIARQFPAMPRFMTGYDLAHMRDEAGGFDINALVAGSEGTLAFITEAKLRILPLPAHRRLLAIRYATFDAALASAEALVRHAPGAIETIDDNILSLARHDPIWHRVGHLLEDAPGQHTAAINLVEFHGDDAAAVESKAQALLAELETTLGQPGQAIGVLVAPEPAQAAALWELRKKGVGLLGAMPGDRRPVAFVEDTAVPPEKLAAYVKEFRALLDAAGLRYGMFGHVDVGCLHVRPALNLRDPNDERLLREISDKVVELVKSYGGQMWAEHGKGFRSEYSPRFFGDELFGDLCRIKRAFDPYNQLNPGKIAFPADSGAALSSVDTEKRAAFDRQIAEASSERYAVAIHCNGNGACFDYNPDSVMCPSARATRDRVHSPKGRAGMLREWLRQLSLAGYDAAHHTHSREGSFDEWLRGAHARATGQYDFSHEVYAAMDGCLSCKACATQCPIKVDVPEFKSDFLALYHRRYPRPLKDYFVAALEGVVGLMSFVPRLLNAVLRARWFRAAMRSLVGVVDVPLLSVLTMRKGLRARQARMLGLAELGALDARDRADGVIIVQDAFTTFYEAHVVLALYDFLVELGYKPYVLEFMENGKALHVKGFLGRFRHVAAQAKKALADVEALGMPLIGVDPAITLTYRDEYRRVPGEDIHVHLLQEWLVERREQITERVAERGYRAPRENRYFLMGHCTERTLAPASQDLWKRLFECFGLELELVPSGCCGMSGMYGHEEKHLHESRALYAMSWERHLPNDPEERRRYLAPGHSCRSQVERFDGAALRHPVEALLEVLRS